MSGAIMDYIGTKEIFAPVMPPTSNYTCVAQVGKRSVRVTVSAVSEEEANERIEEILAECFNNAPRGEIEKVE